MSAAMTRPGSFDKTERKVSWLSLPGKCTLDKPMGGVLPRRALGLPQRVALAATKTTNYCLASTPMNVDNCAAPPAKDRAKAFVLHDSSALRL